MAGTRADSLVTAPTDPVTRTPSPSGIDRTVVIRGAAGGLIIAMVAALANVVLAVQEPRPTGLLNLTFVGLVLGFLLAGFVGGYESTHQHDRHGTYAGLAAFVPVEVVGLLGRLDRGDGVSIPAIVLLAFIAAIAGLGGSRLGAARRRTSDAKAAARAQAAASTEPDPADPGRATE